MVKGLIDALRMYNKAATKFIDKVDSGKAHSVETYEELKNAREQSKQALNNFIKGGNRN